jgi:acyl-CoA dehydrogenase
MALLYDEGQQAIASESRRVLEARMGTDAQLRLLEEQGAFHPIFWDTAKEQGWTGLALPEAYGGLGLGLVDLGLLAHQTGRAIAGAPFLTSCFGAARAILDHGNDALKEKWLPLLASGESIGAIAFAEGQNVLGTSVSYSNGKLNGTKPAVIGGLQADVAVVLASDSGETVLAVAALEGVETRLVSSFDNSRCYANLIFDNTDASEIARGHDALAAAFHVFALQAVVTAHEQTGGAEALMERARDYACTRKAFGQAIGAFQAVKHRIAEMYGLVELARASAIHAAATENSPEFLRAAAAARIQASEAYDTAARDCVQLHGGIGVTWDAGIHLHMRRARSLANEQGSILFWEDVLTSELAGVAA